MCTASDVNQTQTPPLRYVSNARVRRAFVHDIVRYIWPPRYRTLDESAIDIAISCNRYDHYIVRSTYRNITDISVVTASAISPVHALSSP